MRGLKQEKYVEIAEQRLVASFTDAWIETKVEYLSSMSRIVASFTDAWIETIKLRVIVSFICRILYGCVD